MPLIWEIPDSYPEEAVGEYEKASSPDRFLFRQGRRLEDLPPPTIRFDVRADQLREFDCLEHNGTIPIVSQRVSEVLLRICRDDVQLFPAVIRAIDSELVGYSLVNATREVAAVDYANSSFIPIPGTKAVMKFNRLRHRPGVFDGIHLARERDCHSQLLVSETLADEILRLGFTGLHFMRPEDVHP